MNIRIKTLMVAALGGLLMLASTAAYAQDMGKLIDYRRNVMKAIGAATSDIVMNLKGQVPFGAEHVAAEAEAIHALSKVVPSLFPAGSGPDAGDTNALPAIWEHMDQVKTLAGKLESESAKLAEVAKAGDMKAIGEQMGVLGKEACGACHHDFRKPPPK